MVLLSSYELMGCCSQFQEQIQVMVVFVNYELMGCFQEQIQVMVLFLLVMVF